MSKNSKRTKSSSKTRRPTSIKEFNPDHSYVKRDLKQIVILASSFFVILIVLSFILN